MKLCVVICTHNRRALLEKTIHSLMASRRPPHIKLELMVVANACSDDTQHYLEQLGREGNPGWSLRWREEPKPGKSHALNSTLPQLEADWIALVDDDHRISDDFLLRIGRVITEQPGADMICGCIRPDWRGNEPDWVRDRGPYRIYPVPVPHFEPFDNARDLGADDPIPGGGNLVLKAAVPRRIGPFSTELGPVEDGLAGSEDTDFVLRALAVGFSLRYDPSIIQFHFVDPHRLRFGYVLRKAYQRSCSVTRVKTSGGPTPRHLWRKLAEYALRGLFAFAPKRVRFFSVRVAATLGEIRAYRLGPPARDQDRPKTSGP